MEDPGVADAPQLPLLGFLSESYLFSHVTHHDWTPTPELTIPKQPSSWPPVVLAVHRDLAFLMAALWRVSPGLDLLEESPLPWHGGQKHGRVGIQGG